MASMVEHLPSNHKTQVQTSVPLVLQNKQIKGSNLQYGQEE
jgi:hypothetical protein